ncbi:MAG: phosphatase PAP2 family protein [Clostridiales bacterium]|nr:phosphatase PAP2 family protein [Clostridiales bacterium]
MKLGAWFTRRYAQARFRLVDFNCLAYFGVIAFLLIFFHRTVPAWPTYVLIHALVIVAILEIVRLGESLPRRRGLWFLRTFYPVAAILIGWSEIDALVRMFFGGYWATDLLIRADVMVFGVHPTVWVQKFYRPWLDELMAVCYSGYYLFLPLATLPLFIKKKYEETLAVFSVSTFVLFINYFLFYLMPVLSPVMTESLDALHTRRYSGHILAEITRFLQDHGSVRGGTFPSSHISQALAWALMAFRYNRKMGRILLPVVLGVAVSTVYLGYHHALDPIAGLLLGALLYPVGIKIIKARGEDPR